MNKKHIIITAIILIIIYFLFFYKNPFNGSTWYQRFSRRNVSGDAKKPIPVATIKKTESNFSPVEYANYPNLTGNPVSDIAILNQSGFRYDH